MRGRPRTPLSERLWSRVSIGPGCWIWKGHIVNTGYGALRIGGGGSPIIGAHRASWELSYGPVPDGLFVLHRCDVRLCVRPTHLFLGTAADNSADMVRKGRGRWPGPKTPLRGESHPMAKLTLAQVQEIRRRYRAGGITQAHLGAEYGVDQTTVSDLLNRTW
jgi:hypothetical protein